MSEEVESLRAELAELRAELAEESDARLTRRRLLSGLAGIGAVGAASIATAPPSGAAAGDPLLISTENEAGVAHTFLTGSTDSSVYGLLTIEQEGSGPALMGMADTGDAGVVGTGGSVGLKGWGDLYGVLGSSNGFAGVFGEGESGAAGVGAQSTEGPGLSIEDSAVHAFLKPATDPGPPSSGSLAHLPGMLHVDAGTDVWLCTAGGTPGTWTRLVREDTAAGRTIPITPIRVLDTRATGGRASGAPAVPGQRKGPLRGGETVTLDLAGVGPIPATASGVVGNATLLTPDGNGFLRILPAGATVPASSFNFQDGITIANGFTCALAPAGLSAVAPISSSIHYHLVLDIAAYIT